MWGRHPKSLFRNFRVTFNFRGFGVSGRSAFSQTYFDRSRKVGLTYVLRIRPVSFHKMAAWTGYLSHSVPQQKTCSVWVTEVKNQGCKPPEEVFNALFETFKVPRLLEHHARASTGTNRRGNPTGEFQVTVCGVTVCPFSRHKGNRRPKCL